MDEFNQQQNALLDSALNELAIAPLPPDFTNQVIANIHAANAHSTQREAVPAAPIRFRLQFLDIALALFWSLTLAVIWMITLWWAGLLRLDWLPQAQPSISFVEQLSLTNPSLLLAGIILLLLEMSLLGLVGLNLLGERPSAL
jgi:hypothetical protein